MHFKTHDWCSGTGWRERGGEIHTYIYTEKEGGVMSELWSQKSFLIFVPHSTTRIQYPSQTEVPL